MMSSTVLISPTFPPHSPYGVWACQTYRFVLRYQQAWAHAEPRQPDTSTARPTEAEKWSERESGTPRRGLGDEYQGADRAAKGLGSRSARAEQPARHLQREQMGGAPPKRPRAPRDGDSARSCCFISTRTVFRKILGMPDESAMYN